MRGCHGGVWLQGGHVWWGGMHGCRGVVVGGRHGCWGACVVTGGCAWLWGECMVAGGVHACGGGDVHRIR